MEETLNVCTDCGYEGPEGPGKGQCPECGGEMVPSDDINGDVDETEKENMEEESEDSDEELPDESDEDLL